MAQAPPATAQRWGAAPAAGPQAHHEAARQVIGWAVSHRVGTLVVGDPRGVLGLDAGRVHNQRVRDWRVGQLVQLIWNKLIGLALSAYRPCVTPGRSRWPGATRA